MDADYSIIWRNLNVRKFLVRALRVIGEEASPPVIKRVTLKCIHAHSELQKRHISDAVKRLSFKDVDA